MFFINIMLSIIKNIFSANKKRKILIFFVLFFVILSVVFSYVENNIQKIISNEFSKRSNYQMKLDDVPRVVVEELSSAQNEIHTTLCELLTRRKMTLCNEQLHFAIGQIEKYPTALYLRLAVRVVSGWRSFDTK